MKLKQQQYWAIIVTLLFHAVLFWLLFFAEIGKFQKEKTYEIELDAAPIEDVKEQKQEQIKAAAEQQLAEMLSNKAAKRGLRGEKIKQTSQQLKEEFEERQQQSEALFKTKNASQITFSEEKDTLKKEEKTQKEKPQTVFFVGNSRVEYFLAERYRVKLPIPVYKCEGAGTVEVAISVNRMGMVVAAEVVKQRSNASECMREAALNAALTSEFSKHPQAAAIQYGRVVYKFAAQ